MDIKKLIEIRNRILNNTKDDNQEVLWALNDLDTLIYNEQKSQPFMVELNSKQAETYRREQMEKILSAPCKMYIYKDGKYIEL